MFAGVVLALSVGAYAAPEPGAEDESESTESDGTEEEPPYPPEEPAPVSERVIQLAPPELLPSALDDLDRVHAEADDTELAGLLAMARDLVDEQLRLPIRSTLFARPRVTGLLAFPEDGLRGGVGLGVAVGQRWWPMEEGTVRWSGENRVEFDGMVGGTRGYRVGLTVHAGPWIGPIGIRGGARLDAGRLRAGAATLDGAVLLGPELIIAANVAGLHPWFGVAPQWDLSGKRTPAKGPTLGTETVWTGGLAVETAMLWPRVEAAVRTTAIGPVVTLGVGFIFRPNLNAKRRERNDEDEP